MTMKKTFLFFTLLLLASVIGPSSCSYHNDDNPNEYPDPQPEPEPEPEPQPDVNEKYLEASYTPNCFMVKPGESVDIPVLKAYAIWDLYAEWLDKSDFTGMTPEPVLLWQDTPGLITNVGLIPGQTAEEGSIFVSTADKVGNALIGLRIGGEIRWSWHIWVTRYDPNAELVAFGKIYTWDNNGDGVADYTFMDRNLGAVIDKALIENTPADSLAACGLLYQWGRKDPFPGDRILRGTNQTDYNRFDSKPIYDAAGTLLTEGSQSGGTGIRTIRTSEDLTRTNFAKSIFSPMHFLLADNWFPSEEPLKVEACDTLWCGARGKTPVRSLSRRVVCPGGQERTVRMERTRQGHDRLFATRGLSLCRIPLPRRWRMPEEFGIQYRYLDSGYLPALHLHHSLRPTSQHKKRQGLSQRRIFRPLC